MILTDFRDAVVADFQALMPELRIESHFGPFDVDELSKFTRRAPAVMVSIVGAASARQVANRQLDVEMHCAAFIVTRATASLPADAAALNIAESLAGHLSMRKFGDHSEPAGSISITNHYAGASKGIGPIALFATEWRQVVRIGASVSSATGETVPLPSEIYVGEEFIYEGGEA